MFVVRAHWKVSAGGCVTGGGGVMSSRLPRGIVTFLFTDIEGSTELARRVGADAFAKLLATHHHLIRSVLTARDGREVDTAGDGFFAAFHSARNAVAVACHQHGT